TAPLSARELADICGDDLSRRSVQRALLVLGDPDKAGVVTPHRKKRDDDPRINDRNRYTFHCGRWRAWSGKERPSRWDPKRAPIELPPPVGARRVEAARLATGRPTHDPETASLMREAVRQDKRVWNAHRSEAAAVARREKAEGEDRELEQRLVAY